MQVRLEYFGQLRERCGVASEVVTLPEGSTVAVALAAIIQKHGSTLTPLIFNSEQRQASAALLLAIGEQQAVVDSELYDGASLLLLPPVSGGQ